MSGGPPGGTPVAVVCGGSSGIGLAIAERLADDGHELVLCSRSPEMAADRLRERAPGGRVRTVAGDLAEPATAAAVIAEVERLGRLDALLLNHGGPPVKPFASIDDASWDAAYRLMVRGPLRLLRDVLPHLERSHGRVVAITSFCVKDPVAGLALSNSLRAALVGALKTVAQEVGAGRVLINAVGPGYVLTERLAAYNMAQAERQGLDLATYEARAVAEVPLGRFGTPDEISELVAFLLSDRNTYLTGQHLLVDGGLTTAT